MGLPRRPPSRRTARAVPLWLQSLRARPAAFLAILLLSAGAVLVSAATPLLLTAADAAVLQERVSAAGLPDDGVAVTAQATGTDALPIARTAVDEVLGAARRASPRLGRPQQLLQVQASPRIIGPGGRSVAVEKAVGVGGPHSLSALGIAVAPTSCAGLTLTGRCPASALEALVPRSLAGSTGWNSGSVLRAESGGASTPLTVIGSITVVGVYDDGRGSGRLLAHPLQLAQASARNGFADLLVGQQGLDRLRQPLEVVAAVRTTGPVRQEDVSGLLAAAAAASRAALGTAGGQTSAAVSTGLPALLGSVVAEQGAGAVLAAPVGLAAVLLAWSALLVTAQRAARARALEWGVGRMRGARVRAWLGFVLGEPSGAVLVGAVAGAVLAALLGALIAPALFGAGAAASLVAPAVVAAAALGLVGSLVALVAASARTALEPLPRLLQGSAEPRRRSRLALVARVAAVTLAAAVAWVALTTGSLATAPLGLLLPAALAVVVGLAVAQLAVLLVRRGSTRPPRSLLGLVVGRGVARAPSALAAAQLVLVSAALAAFALQLVVVTTATQTQRAQLATGAPEVLSVAAPNGVDLLTAVRRADPAGRTAMAVQEVAGTPGRAGGTVLAVDAARMATVGYWRLASPSTTLLQRLAPAARTEPAIRGTRLDVDLHGAPGGFRDVGDDTTIDVTAVLDTGVGSGWRTVALGTVFRPHDAPIPCAAGCRLVAFQFTDQYDTEQWRTTVTIRSISTDRQSAAQLAPLLTGGWRLRVADRSDPTTSSSVRATSSTAGLRLAVVDGSGTGTVSAEPAVGPALVPAVLGSDGGLQRFAGVPGAVLGTSLAEAPILLHPVGIVVAVPATLRTGVLVDLATMRRAEDSAGITAADQVWLAAGDHRAILAALQREGLRVQSTASADDAVAAALRSATERAALVAAAAGGLGVLFGLLALVAARIVDRPLRREEWAVLRLGGAPRRRLRLLALVQTALPAAVAAVLGVATGSIAALLIAARLPLLVGRTPGPALDLAPPLLLLALLAAVLVGLVIVLSTAVTAPEVPREDRA